MTIDEVLSRFQNPQPNGKGFKVRCPVHEDTKNSLCICETDTGKILLKCMAGCKTKTVIDAVGLVWPDLSKAVAPNGNQQRPNDPITGQYVYVDANGSPLFQVSRTRFKNFFQSRFDPVTKKYMSGMDDTQRVLYRLPAVLSADDVFVVEGEKDADNLSALGLAATTNAGGASKWTESYSQALKGKNVIIFPDNDEPGQNHALSVAKSVLSHAKSIKIVSLADLPPKGDVSDFLQTHRREELLHLVELAELFTGNADAKGQANLWPEFLTAKEILTAPKDPTRWILEGCLAAAGCSIVVAKPKIGKSTTVADLCMSVARGEPWLGRATQQGAVAYLFLDGPLPEIADVFVKLGLRESDPIYLHAGSAPRDCIDWLLSTVKQKGVKLVVIDTMQKLLKFKDINDYAEVTNGMEPLLEVARQGNCHILILHHAGKYATDDLDAAIGSTAIRGLCYAYVFLKLLHPKSERRILSSNQRGGTNFPETAIGFDRVTGRLEIQGTADDAEIEEAKPKIRELLKTEDQELSVKEIREAIPMKAIVVSKALRELFKANEVERTGEGKKNNPFRYSLPTDLTLSNAHFVDSSPREGVVGGETSGHESGKHIKEVEKTAQIQVPNGLDTNRTRIDTDPKTQAQRHESENTEEILI